MSMLVDWFFCVSTGCGPRDAHALLDTTRVLGRLLPGRDDVLDGARSLRSASPWVQVYGLRPLLTAAGRVSEATPEGADEELVRALTDICRNALALSDDPLTDRLVELVGATLHDLPGTRERLHDEVARPLFESMPGTFPETATPPYQDLAEQVFPTLTVLLLAEQARRRPSAASQDWLGDRAVPLAATAIDGGFGRLAQLTAVSAAAGTGNASTEQLVPVLWRAGGGSPHLQPDILDALARLHFGPTMGPPRVVVAAIESEGITGDVLWQWRKSLHTDDDATRRLRALLTGQHSGSAEPLGSVLWQAVLWDLAAQLDALETADWLGRWWQHPHRTSPGRITVHVGRISPRAETVLRGLQQLRWTQGGPVAVTGRPITDNDPKEASSVCSPWLLRKHEAWDHGRRGGSAFSCGAWEPEALLRLIASASTALELVTALSSRNAPVPDHVTAVVFHAYDVLRDHADLAASIATDSYTGEYPLAPALVTGIYHVERRLELVGRGVDLGVPPQVLTVFARRLLEDDATADLDDDVELARLARQALSGILCTWMMDAWYHSTDAAGDQGPARWFAGDPGPALQLLPLILDRATLVDRLLLDELAQEKAARSLPGEERTAKGRKYGRLSARALKNAQRKPEIWHAALLLKWMDPVYYARHARARWSLLANENWTVDAEQRRRNFEGLVRQAGGDPAAVRTNLLNPKRFLLSPQQPLAVWTARLADVDNWARTDPAPIMVRTVRLEALLRDELALRSGAHDDWLADWLDRVYGLSVKHKVARDFVMAMIQLADVELASAMDEELERKVTSVYAAMVDVVLEVARSAARPVGMLLHCLTRGALPGFETTNGLWLRALETVYRQRRVGGRLSRFVGVTEARGTRESMRAVNLVLRRFLCDITVGRSPSPGFVSIDERARELWERLQIGLPLAAAPVPLESARRGTSILSDDLLLVATIRDRHRDAVVAYRLDVALSCGAVSALPVEADCGRDAPVDLFNRGSQEQESARRWAEETGAPVLGVLAALEDQQAWVNVGTGAPVICQVPGVGREPVVGDVVDVSIQDGSLRPPGALQRRPPQPDEIRTATVRVNSPHRREEGASHIPWLDLAVDGVTGDQYPTGDGMWAERARQLWDPDLERPWRSPDEVTTIVPSRWDDTIGYWVPVVRGFTELIIDELAVAESVRLVHAGDDLWVTSPGRVYRLDPWDWSDDLYEVLQLFAHQAVGLAVRALLVSVPEPRLVVQERDDVNVRWREQFGSLAGEVLVATRDASGVTSVEAHSPDEPSWGSFPERVSVEGAGLERHSYVSVGAWDDRAARRAVLPVSPLDIPSVPDHLNPSGDRFDALFDVSRGQHLTLDRIFSGTVDGGLLSAVTALGLAVRVEADSLLLTDALSLGRTMPGLVRGRSVRVTDLPEPRQVRSAGPAVAVVELASRTAGGSDGQPDCGSGWEVATHLDGVVVAVAGGAGRRIYGAWCRLHGAGRDGPTTPVYVDLDEECLGVHRPQATGQVFTGRRVGDAWQFTLLHRDVVVRALFDLREDDRQEGDVFVGSDRDHDYYQRGRSGQLVRRPGTGEDPVERLLLRQARVSRPRRGHPGLAIRMASGNRDRVLLGQTESDPAVVDPVVTSVEIRIAKGCDPRPAPPQGGAEGGVLVDVVRHFGLSPRKQPRKPVEADADHRKRWQDFLDRRVGQQRCSLADDGWVELEGLNVPDPGGWTRRVQLLEGEDAFIPANQYSTVGARVRLIVQDDGTVRASFRAVKPLTMALFMQYMHRRGFTDGQDRSFAEPVYYVGLVDDGSGSHLFEWGYGWTVIVPGDRLQVDALSTIAGVGALFHGDGLIGGRFEQLDDADDLLMVVDGRELQAGQVTRILREAANESLVHFIEVAPTPGTGVLRVVRALSTRSQQAGSPLHRAEWVPFTAVLDDQGAALLAARAGGGLQSGRVRVLARFEQDDAVASRGRRCRFTVIREAADSLRKGDRLFLQARQLLRSKNEVTLVFACPGIPDAKELEVHVGRRQFSFRQETLARTFPDGLQDDEPVVMLVQLLGPRSHWGQPPGTGPRSWRGSTTNVPVRPSTLLTSYLNSRGGSVYAIFGTMNGSPRLEVAPGVFYEASWLTGVRECGHGAVVLVRFDAVGDVAVTTALPADRAYVPAAGRPSVVLPKPGLKRASVASSARDLRQSFVVDGLADVTATPDASDVPELLATPHPKVGVVRRAGNQFVLRPTRGRRIRYGQLRAADPEQDATIEPRPVLGVRADPARPLAAHAVPWARMSFRDGSAREVADACAAATWRHQDRSTFHLAAEGGRPVTVMLDPVSVIDEGVFFGSDNGWTLRYRGEELLTHGYPATSLLDGAPGGVYGLKDLPVAAANQDGTGVWVEHSPGRVIEIKGALVRSIGGTSLERFDWSALAPGDLLHVEASRTGHTLAGWHTEPAHLVLTGWTPSLRGALPSPAGFPRRILLPLAQVDDRDGALVLGAGRWTLRYPTALGAMASFSGCPSMWLDTTNGVRPAPRPRLRPGDTLLLAEVDGQPGILGMPSARVELAEPSEATWPGSEWMHDALSSEFSAPDASGAQLLRSIGGCLPVTVERVTRDGRRVTVSRSGQPNGSWPANSVLLTEVMGAWRGEWLVLRHGGGVRAVHILKAVPGLPAPLRRLVADALAADARERGRGLWWTVDERGNPSPGWAPAGLGADLEVVPQIEVVQDGGPVGAVCRDVASGRLHWLPVGEASWARDVPAGELLVNLTAHGQLAVRRLEDGTVSATRRSAVVHQLSRLSLGSALRVVVGHGDPVPIGDGRFRYAAHLEVPSVLLSYVSAEASYRPGTSRLTEVDFVERNERSIVETVDVGSRRVTMELPDRYLDWHRWIVSGPLEGDPPWMVFEDYHRWYAGGDPVHAAAEGPEALALVVAGAVTDGASPVDREQLVHAARTWIGAFGEIAWNLVPDRQLDAALALAGAVVLDAAGAHDPVWAAAAVLTLRQVGRRAVASLHTEAFARTWLTEVANQARGGAWLRLRRLPLARKLDRSDLRTVRDFCHGILVKPVLRDVEVDLAGVARSLLGAVAELESGSRLAGDAPGLSAIAAWSRAMMPGAGRATAQPELLPAQVAALHAITDAVVLDEQPLCLLPPALPLRREEQDFAAELMCRASAEGSSEIRA